LPGSRRSGEDLQPEGQPVRREHREAQPELGEFEAALRGVREVVVGRRVQEPLTDEAVDLELRQVSRQAQPHRRRRARREERESRYCEDEAHSGDPLLSAKETAVCLKQRKHAPLSGGKFSNVD
jgi:hypothetical protein